MTATHSILSHIQWSKWILAIVLCTRVSGQDTTFVAEWLFGAIGGERITGAASETLAKGWTWSLFEYHGSPLPHYPKVRVGLAFLAWSDHEYLLTPDEKQILEETYTITVESSTTKESRPLDEVTGRFYRLMTSLRYLPLGDGLSPGDPGA